MGLQEQHMVIIKVFRNLKSPTMIIIINISECDPFFLSF